MSYDMGRIIQWKTLTRKWEECVQCQIRDGTWPLKPLHDSILAFTILERFDDEVIARKLDLHIATISEERSRALLALLRSYKSIADQYPDIPEIARSAGEKLELLEKNLQVLAGETKLDEGELLSEEALLEFLRKGALGRLVVHYFVDLRSSISVEKNSEFLTVEKLAAKTGYHPDWLRQLIVTGEIQGCKVGKAWMSTKEAVQAYQAKQGKIGRPRKPHVSG